jgi:hypothetical protein
MAKPSKSLRKEVRSVTIVHSMAGERIHPARRPSTPPA